LPFKHIHTGSTATISLLKKPYTVLNSTSTA
jgi:hypothetical protein